MNNLLIVDDNPDVLNMLQKVFVQEGYYVHVAASSNEAFALARKHSLQAAIIDINMPGEHGISLSWRLRNLLPDLPIMIYSGKYSSWDLDDIKHCGADCLLKKPGNIKNIISLVNNFSKNGRGGACRKCEQPESCAWRNVRSQLDNLIFPPSDN